MTSYNVRELGLSKLVYVSRSKLAVDGDASEVDGIVDLAVARNSDLRVTGALLYTQLHFAQVLEGPRQAVTELFARIAKDPRHCDVTIVAEEKISGRLFPYWSMAYAGPIPYLDRQLKPLLSPLTSHERRLQLADRLVHDLQRIQVEQ